LTKLENERVKRSDVFILGPEVWDNDPRSSRKTKTNWIVHVLGKTTCSRKEVVCSYRNWRQDTEVIRETVL
jgi:hypothetical protein